MALKTKVVNGQTVVVDDMGVDTSLAPQTVPTENSLSGYNLRPEIMERAGDVYREDAENNKGRTPGWNLLDTVIPRQGTSKTGGSKQRSSGTILDPYNIFGGRKSAIDKIIKEGGSDLVDSYDPETGKYSALPQWNRTMDGVMDDDITKALVLRQATQRKNTPEYRALTPEQKKNVGTLTESAEILKTAQAATKLKNTKDAIRGLDKGGMWLDDYIKYELKGKDPTQDQLTTLKTEIEALQPARIQEMQAQDNSNTITEDTVKNTQSLITQREKATALAEQTQRDNHSIQQRNATTAEGTLSLAQTKASNELTQQQFENADRVSYRNHQSSEADKLRNFQATEKANDRAMQMEINLLGREDTREQRAYDRKRDERQDRQMMIMQMMKGLQNLGGAFAL